METKLELITPKAKEDRGLKFTALAHHLTEAFLMACYGELNRQSAPGIDQITVQAYGENLQENIRNLVPRMKQNPYRPQPVRRTYIPKASGGERALGIPAIEDKIVQMGITKILMAIYEADFLECSYGYRPGKSAHEALNVVDKILMRQPVHYIIDADIRGFFDNVQHRWMEECLQQRIADPNFLRLVVRFLKAGIMEGGEYQASEKGTPQGGILSPVLSNIYLHYVLDLWFAKRMKKRLQGYAEEVRWADDFIICVEYPAEAEQILEHLRERLKQFGLELAEDKTRCLAFGRQAAERAKQGHEKPATFDFLGFTHFCDKTRKGQFKVGRRTSRKKLRIKLKEINQWLKAVRNQAPMRQWWPILRAKLAGHMRYFGVSGNMPRLKRYHLRVLQLTFKWLNRRSQKQSYTWAGFNQMLKYYALPQPRIYHNLYTLSTAK